MRINLTPPASDTPLGLETITRILPLDTLQEAIDACGAREQRQSKLTAMLTLLLCISMKLYSHYSWEALLVRLAKPLRWLSVADVPQATKGAISMARSRLGVRPLAYAFHHLCQPIATPNTPGAFAFGRHLVAFDGTTERVVDTADNERVFGRPSNSNCPLVQAIYLCELGTHVVFDAVFHPYGRMGEREAATRMLRSVTWGMLLLLDRGFYGYDMLLRIRSQLADVLVRVPDTAKFDRKARQYLEDGSYLVSVRPSDAKRRRSGEYIVMRVIEYTLDDPGRPGHRQRARLMTSMLDAEACPALEVACLYHERWEIEVAIDEMDTHQQAPSLPLRSLKATAVLQELYALLLAHFVVRSLMHETACAYEIDPDRLSFLNSLRLIQDVLPGLQLLDRSWHERIWQQLREDMMAFLLPPRRNRVCRREVKQRTSTFSAKHRGRHRRPQPTCSFREAVVIYGA